MPPLRFVLGLHFHQPVGSLDAVVARQVERVNRPLLRHLADRELLPVVLHVSGPLLEWLEEHDRPWLDRLGRLASDGRVELLLSGLYEPILPALPRADRVEQIQWMREALRRRFGVDAQGLWLTERVWEPDLAGDLAAAGVRYTLLGERHFIAAGFTPAQLHRPFWTEGEGRRLALFPINERLSRATPLGSPDENVEYLRQLRAEGHGLAVQAGDGEEFAVVSGTGDQAWPDRFTAAILKLSRDDEIRLSRLDTALSEVPSGGLAYPPAASHCGMEARSLPAETSLRMAGADGAFDRGDWRGFLVKYPEANRMHKKMQHLSALCRRRGNPAGPRRAIGRAQCNDAYWHGTSGGLYLPHLRDAVWRNLARAEAELRRGKSIRWEVVDFDGDGREEVWIHSHAFSALLSPHRGGGLEELTTFGRGTNYANVLTRRHGREDGGGVPLDQRPRSGSDERAIFVERILPGALSRAEYARGVYRPVVSWAGARSSVEIVRRRGAVEIVCRSTACGAELTKRLRFDVSGLLRVSFRWDPSAAGAEDVFTTELSLAAPVALDHGPEPELWRFPIETIERREGGLDRIRQGDSLTLRWPVSAGSAWVELRG